MNGVTGINLATFALVQGPSTTFEGSVFRGNAFLNPGAEVSLVNAANVGVAVKQDGGVRCTAAAYTGNSDLAVTLASDGTLQKTAATISATGNINGLHINASGDMSCANMSAGALRSNQWINSTNAASIDLAPTAGGAVGFRGTEYANSAGKLLSIVDTAGRLAPLNLVGPGTLRVDANGVVSVLRDALIIHNLTSATSNPDYTVSSSSKLGNDEQTFGGWRCFDDLNPTDGLWVSAHNTYAGGNPTTGVIPPMPIAGSWVIISFQTNKTISKVKIKPASVGLPADFGIAKRDVNNNWINTGFYINAEATFTANPTGYSEFTIPVVNGGGAPDWYGIGFVFGRITNWNHNNAVEIRELDFQ
jgi:hypothetical protein